jgi:hypothetical protein
MGYQPVSSLSFLNAQKACEHLIDNIYEFVDSINNVFPSAGYDVLASHLVLMKTSILTTKGPFIKNDDCDKFIGEFLDAFTRFNPDIEQNLQGFHNAYLEIAKFFEKNPAIGSFQLTDYGNDRVEQMIKINHASNEVLVALKNDPCNVITLYASFAIHSSKTQMSEYALLNELSNYKKLMETNSVTVSFDPIKIFSVKNSIQQKDGTFITEARAIRNLVDHHKFDLDIKSDPCTIHFKSQSGKNWNFTYDRKFIGSEFKDYLALLDAFYKCLVNILFCYQLLAVLRAKFVI